ncbi:hypothetical protein [Halomicronema sp. CCY15110]|uniref:hypothetical protein n=1 Tax=Halomicronema sp. CCY15110 TaxID=2767773 RepID=UPI0019519A13|nr:hypothetical protein [Halomicronema sp. CCY15110]
MPGRDELRSLHEQLEAIATVIELSPTAQQMLSDPQTDFQCRMRRDLMRLRTARLELAHANEIVKSLLR